METQLFNYNLPRRFIAQKPAEERDLSKLMIFDKSTGEVSHRQFRDIVDFLKKGDLLVVNDSKVFPARIESRKEKTGGVVRFLLIRNIDDNLWEAVIEKGRSLKEGMEFPFFGGKIRGTVICKKNANCTISFSSGNDEIFRNLDEYAFMPLPPYIKRNGCNGHVDDKERYQTVYARHRGSIAAPTAGLHFTRNLLNNIRDKGVDVAGVTLHVGRGTFIPVKTDSIEDHTMEEEEYIISDETATLLNDSLKEGRRIITVGTTATRALENELTLNGKFVAGRKKADIFIIPGYQFKAIKGLVTNFHLPASTLLALVSAFCGREKILAAYERAKENNYRFYSYGDAMFII